MPTAAHPTTTGPIEGAKGGGSGAVLDGQAQGATGEVLERQIAAPEGGRPT